MKGQGKDRIWELSIKALNNSLEQSEAADFKQFKDIPDAQKEIKKAEQIHKKLINHFLLKKIDKEKQWKQVYSQISFTTSLKKQFLFISRYAAVFIIALSIGVLIPHFIKHQETGSNKIEIEWGQIGKVTLSDNTKVWLNAGTVFEYPNSFSEKERIVHLRGEAQFKVTHNENKPFEVVTKSGIVKVFGTTFNVAAYDDDPDFTVTLIEGKVSVENTNGQQLAILKPAEQIKINKLSGETSIKNVLTEYYTSWINGKITLNETKLSDLVPTLKKLYNVDIEIVGQETADIQVSGTISRNRPIDLFFKVLEGLYNIKYEIKTQNNEKDKILIYKD